MRDDREGTDGWVDYDEPREADIRLDAAPDQPLQRFKPAHADDELLDEEVAAGRAMAVLCYASILFGLPLFIIPMMTRDNRFALHHAKASGVTFVAFFISAMLTGMTCGLFFPIMMFFYIPALIGVIQAANGKLAGTWGFGEAGERLFSGIRVKEEQE